MKFGVGQAVKRLEDQALITGGGRFTDDFKLPNPAHAYILRSPHAHARILRLDTSKAKVARGVLAVLTGADVEADGLGLMPCMIPMTSRDGKPRYDTPRPVLAKDRVRHVGDPVALVVAETLSAARDAAEKIEVEYEELPHAVDTYAAAQAGAPKVWEHIPNNIAFDWEKGDRAGVEAALKGAHRVIKLRIVNNRVVVNSMEARACLGDYDAAKDRVTLYTSCQSVHGLRTQLADAIFKIPKEKVRVVSGNVGGGFGMKLFLHPETVLIPWATRRLKRAVRWAADRSEGFQSDVQGRDHVSFAELALDKDAHFLALKVETYANEGAYLSNYAPFVATGGSDMHVGLYKTPAIYTRVAGIVTNTVPIDAYRGSGRPEATWINERLIELGARALAIDTVEIRRRNLLAKSDFPYPAPGGRVYDSGDPPALLEKLLDLAGYGALRREQAALRKQGVLLGIGLACFIDKAGTGPSSNLAKRGGLHGGWESAIVRVHSDGKVTVYAGSHSHGQGHEITFAQIAADRLGLPIEHIRVVEGDTDQIPFGNGTWGARSVSVAGTAIFRAADKVLAKARHFAALVLECDEAAIDYDDGNFTARGTNRGVSFADIADIAYHGARVPADGSLSPGLEITEFYDPPDTNDPQAMHLAVVIVDPETGTVRLRQMFAADDCGVLINPMIVEGQVHGGLAQGIGQALLEQCVYDAESGQLLTGSYMDYAMPRADDVPSFKVGTKVTPCTHNPLGAKGCGEAGAIGAPAALMNAVMDALAPVGVTRFDMPASPHRVWQAIRSARASA